MAHRADLIVVYVLIRVSLLFRQAFQVISTQGRLHRQWRLHGLQRRPELEEAKYSSGIISFALASCPPCTTKNAPDLRLEGASEGGRLAMTPRRMTRLVFQASVAQSSVVVEPRYMTSGIFIPFRAILGRITPTCESVKFNRFVVCPASF